MGEKLLVTVLCLSLTTTETDTRHIRRNNAKALRLNIEQVEREAAKKAAGEAKADRLAK